MMPDTGLTTVTIPADIVEPLQAAVEAGEFASLDDALREAVENWQVDRWDTPEQAALIRTAVAEAVNDPRPSLSAQEVRAWIASLPDDGDPQFDDETN